jgi:hypothetical protein
VVKEGMRILPPALGNIRQIQPSFFHYMVLVHSLFMQYHAGVVEDRVFTDFTVEEILI